MTDADPSAQESLGDQTDLDGGYGRLAIGAYVRLLAFSEAELTALPVVDKALVPSWPSTMEKLYLHLRRFESTARLLPLDDDRIEGLARAQVAHYRELMQHTLEPGTLQNSRRVGEIHHQRQVHPRWQLGAFAQVIAHQAPVLVSMDLDSITAFVKMIALDASVALESYAVHDRHVFKEGIATYGRPAEDEKGHHNTEGPSAAAQRVSTVRVVGSSELSVRLAFFGLLSEFRDEMSRIKAEIGPVLADSVERFYGIIQSDDELRRYFLVGGPVSFEGLAETQLVYLDELFSGNYDSVFTSKRLRVGKAHLSHQVPTSVYMAGVGLLAAQIIGELSARGRLTVDSLGAVVSALFFDASFVVEAYIEARRAQLLDVEVYASDLLKRLPTGVAVVDSDLRIVSTNLAFLDQFKLSPDLLKGVTLRDAIPSLDLDAEIASSFARPDDGDRHSTLLEPSNDADSSVMRLSSISIPALPGERDRRALLFEDVSDVVDLSDRSRQLYGSFRRLVNNVAAIVWEYNTADDEVVQVGGDTATLLGTVPEDLLGSGRLMQCLFSDDDRANVLDHIEALVHGRTEAFDIVHRAPSDGDQQRWFRSAIQVLEWEQRVVSVVSVEITGEVELRNDLVGQIETLVSIDDFARRLVVESASDRVLDIALTTLHHNFPGAHITIEGDHGVRQVSPPADPVGAPDTAGTQDTAGASSEWTFTEAVAGATVTVRGSGAHKHPNGAEAFSLITRLVGLALQRIEDERTALRNQRFAAIGTVASGVAHDFNNILAALSLSVDDLNQSLTSDHPDEQQSLDVDRFLHRLRQMDAEIQRGRDLVGQMSTFRDPAPGGDQATPVGAEARLEVEQARRRWPTVSFDVDAEDRLQVALTPLQLRRLVANLLKNAADAAATTRVQLSIDEVVFDGPCSTTTGVVESGRYVRVTVADDGEGFSDTAAESAFEPFFTTKAPGEGTGLGLTIVKSLAEVVDGGVSLGSAEPGAVVQVLLGATPAVQPTTTDRGASHPSGPTEVASDQGGGEAGNPNSRSRVLVVDDHEVVAEATAEVLRGTGHDVDYLVDPHRALEAAKTNEYDVLLIDLNMPGLNGVELITRARQAGVDGQFAIVSGLLNADTRALCDRYVIPYIEKPVQVAELDRLVRTLANGRR